MKHPEMDYLHYHEYVEATWKFQPLLLVHLKHYLLFFNIFLFQKFFLGQMKFAINK